MTLKDKMQTAVDKLLNEANGSTETSKIVEVCAEVAEDYYVHNFKVTTTFNGTKETTEVWRNKKG